jgi:PAS domain-containing protein
LVKRVKNLDKKVDSSNPKQFTSVSSQARPFRATYSHMADFVLQPSPDGDTSPAGLVDVLLALSPTGVLQLRPIYEADGELLIDFDLVRLNLAAQRLLQLPESPTASLLTLLPEAHQAGVFALCREAFLKGYLASYAGQYQHDGLGAYTILAAQRHEQLLVVSFAAASEPLPLEPAQPGRQAQRYEQVPHLRGQPASSEAAWHVAERQAPLATQQGLLRQILRQVPAAVATLSGPEHRYTFFNDQYQALSAQRVGLGKTVAQALPELVTQGFVDLLDQVYTTGQPFTGIDKPVQLHNHTTGRIEQRYLDFIYQPLTNEQGQTQGILAFLVDTTERVLARQQVEATNQELATTNARLARPAGAHRQY